ncbi:MAG: hypothetical protein AABP62_20130 [Planctomycetota bacterium]
MVEVTVNNPQPGQFRNSEVPDPGFVVHAGGGLRTPQEYVEVIVEQRMRTHAPAALGLSSHV